MKVWIINPYGNIPGEGWSDYRSTMLANALEKAGHETIWWVSNFVHRSKSYRSDDWRDIQVSPRYLVRIVPSTSYSSHISIGRIRYEQNYMRNVSKKARQCAPPDLIILGEPALFYSKSVIRLVRQWKVKLIVDVIDLWPELFHMIFPPKLSWIGNLLFLPFYRRRAALFRKADAIVAVSKDYLSLARHIAPKKYMDVVYWGVDVQKIRAALRTPAQLPIEICNSPKKSGEVWIVYAGTLGENYDIRSILLAAEMIEREDWKVRLLIAGEGPLKELVTTAIREKQLSKTLYIGRLNPDVLTNVFSICDIALSTYIPSSTVSMPIKAFDYFAAGLPVVNSLERDLGELVRTQNVGLQYEAGDPFSLVRAIEEMVFCADKRKQMRENAFRISKAFDSGVQYDKYVKLLERLCAA